MVWNVCPLPLPLEPWVPLEATELLLIVRSGYEFGWVSIANVFDVVVGAVLLPLTTVDHERSSSCSSS